MGGRNVKAPDVPRMAQERIVKDSNVAQRDHDRNRKGAQSNRTGIGQNHRENKMEYCRNRKGT